MLTTVAATEAVVALIVGPSELVDAAANGLGCSGDFGRIGRNEWNLCTTVRFKEDPAAEELVVVDSAAECEASDKHGSKDCGVAMAS